ncbi:unnamed protein product, partial [Porites evermanni]
YIHYVSPTKESNFFDLQLQSKDKYTRGVCFGPGKRGLFQSVGAPFPKVEIPSTFNLRMLKTIAGGQLITVKAKITTLRTPALLQTDGGPLNMPEGRIVGAKGYCKIIFWEDFCKQVEEGKTYIFANVRVKKDNFTKQLYINTAKTVTVIRPTEQHTEV